MSSPDAAFICLSRDTPALVFGSSTRRHRNTSTQVQRLSARSLFGQEVPDLRGDMKLILQVLFSALSLVVLLAEAEGAATAGGRAVEEGAGDAALQMVAQGLALLPEETRLQWKEALRKVKQNSIKDARSRLLGMEEKLRSLEARIEALERRLPPMEQEEGQEAAERLEGRLTRLEACVQRALEGRSPPEAPLALSSSPIPSPVCPSVCSCTTSATESSTAPAPLPSKASEPQPPTASTYTTPSPGASSAPAPRPSEASEPQPSAASAAPPTADPARRRALGEQLMEEMEEGWLEDVRSLLDAGADPNYARKDGRTPLMEASINGHESVVSLLLKRGADVNAADGDGWTALHCAAYMSYSGRVVALLVAAGARVDAKDNEGHSPLHVAAWGGGRHRGGGAGAGGRRRLHDAQEQRREDAARRPFPERQRLPPPPPAPLASSRRANTLDAYSQLLRCMTELK